MKKYRCECGWVGVESEMEADYTIVNGDGDEAWSNWICPSCGLWQELEDYELINED